MKKVLNYILLTSILGTFLPYSALAQTTDVGVSITGSLSIDVVTTISADITLDLTTLETVPTYMEIRNNSSVPVNAKITNISTTSEGAPSTFVGAADKDWNRLSKDETNTYVNFNIIGSGQNVEAQDILPNREIDLGTLNSYTDEKDENTESKGALTETDYQYLKFYEINANFGKIWSEGDKNFEYQITTVYSIADSYVEPTAHYYGYPSGKIFNLNFGGYYQDLLGYTLIDGSESHFAYDSENMYGYYMFIFNSSDSSLIEGLFDTQLYDCDNGWSSNIMNGINNNYVIDLGAGNYGLVYEINKSTDHPAESKKYHKFTLRLTKKQTLESNEPFDSDYSYTYIVKLVNK